ncbi:MAG: branched-chain amino acid ABC transporter substrate-binding protein [Geminicoccaceae bacterium]|nr:branched-chain amino acid ABC transporter substrate-binding protein [Geminicoccaceae bacterium]MCS7266474.1 branched-chain amino acid ABC transporter substrate-binding protein [Geminicoccaceae bacterium]MCX7629397.1 branched-chain amino acid ABC transporter substrate-binding protein [Geminicoccaceae bacterium]MDW8123930.1 branched-chain amino acid ABC transporter substrate-binding protein [Geminicoccaceae bacterium]MDW8340007.1 branched-chain amino acid ABC transporter substrate-binding prot
MVPLLRSFALCLCLALSCLALSAAVGLAQERAKVTLGYVGLENDPRHRELETYANVPIRPAIVPLDGAAVAMRDARAIGRAIGVELVLEAVRAKDLEGALAAVERLAGEFGARFVLVDLPDEMVAELAARTRGRELVLLNVSARDDRLRGEACAPHLFHVIPSRAMLADALAQHLAFMNWREVLLLVGPEPEDERWGEAFARAIRRFGGRIVDTRRFVSGRDPRQREQNNPRLLTQGIHYDVVAIADTDGEFGRLLPYQTVLPRPVVGTHGLVPVAWHWAYERQGAPQLEQRFERSLPVPRKMTDPEFAAWAAIRAVLDAMARARSAEFAKVRAALLDQNATIDLYKGAPGTFRPWDRQLRQPILLGTNDAVIGRAPYEKFLHQRNTLDTLGVDEPESRCRG